MFRHVIRLGLPVIVLLAVTYASATPIAQTARAPVFVPHILARLPHNTAAYTEGFELYNGLLYESSALEGNTLSALLVEDPQTDQILREVAVPPPYFSEGIGVTSDKIVQLTWKTGIAFVYDLKTLAKIGTFTYDGEGWGMCFDGQQFYMSNGSSTIVARDPNTFAVTRAISVDLDGQPVVNLNELECVGDSLYANVWQTDRILRIDKASGHVTARIEAPNLLTPKERQAGGIDGVLNGIAYDPQSGTFLITGKMWPWMFRVTFVPATYF
ncbi:MAG: glutaminyl-peptide cyclotransferase [Aggregatilineales bacterium]